MPRVPNHRHSGTAAIFSDTTGNASTVPPPCLRIDASAACSANFATPFPRWPFATKKQVILHSVSVSSGAATSVRASRVDPREFLSLPVLTPTDRDFAVVDEDRMGAALADECLLVLSIQCAALFRR